jgi:hypothetical protein
MADVGRAAALADQMAAATFHSRLVGQGDAAPFDTALPVFGFEL